MPTTRRDFIKGTAVLGGTMLVSPTRASASSFPPAGWVPAYAKLEQEGKLQQRIDQAFRLLEACELCPRQCGVNRLEGEKGYCRSPKKVTVYSAHPHFGEEVSLVGEGGSGTIFFSHCNLRCVFCQNWPISHLGRGKELADEDLAAMMINLQQMGCHNINFVTPTHMMPSILGGVRLALKRGLQVPLVYNTSGYERVEMLRLLDGVMDIYLPDMKYSDPAEAAAYSAGASDYPAVARKAIAEMHRQVGVLRTGAGGIAQRGLMIRHLVMPNRVAGTREFVRWVARELARCRRAASSAAERRIA